MKKEIKKISKEDQQKIKGGNEGLDLFAKVKDFDSIMSSIKFNGGEFLAMKSDTYREDPDHPRNN